MKNITRLIIAVVVIGVLAVGAFLAYNWFAGGSGEVSEDISDAAETIDDAGEGIVFRIDPDNSEVSFTLEEDLSGIRTTVIGRTNQVGGDIVINLNTPSESEIGTIRINSRNLATDQEMRNRALRNFILLSSQDEYEFIDFVPTAITGLPENVEVGGTYNFDMTGDLSIIGQSNSVTFTVEVTIDSETQISGTASATVLYADWGISIPSVPRVANVTDDVDLVINFVATAVQDEE